MLFFRILLQLFFQVTSKVQGFFKLWWLQRKVLINIYQRQLTYLKHLFFGSVKMNFNEKTLDLCCRYFAVFWIACKFSDLVNSNICITKIFWTKSNFFSKCDFMSDEDKYKYSLAHREGIVKFRHTLLVWIW